MSTFVKITNKDVYKKLLEMEQVQDEILNHAKITNGRVTKLEARSIGNWVAQHPYKFAAICIVIATLFITDIESLKALVLHLL